MEVPLSRNLAFLRGPQGERRLWRACVENYFEAIQFVGEAAARCFGASLLASPGSKKCGAAGGGIRQRPPRGQFARGKDARGELGKMPRAPIDPIRRFEIDAYFESRCYRKHCPTGGVRDAKVDRGIRLACASQGWFAVLAVLDHEFRCFLIQGRTQQTTQDPAGSDVTVSIAFEMKTRRPCAFRRIEVRTQLFDFCD